MDKTNKSSTNPKKRSRYVRDTEFASSFSDKASLYQYLGETL